MSIKRVHSVKTQPAHGSRSSKEIRPRLLFWDTQSPGEFHGMNTPPRRFPLLWLLNHIRLLALIGSDV